MEPLKRFVNSIRPAFDRFVYLPAWSVAWKDQDGLNLLKYWQAQIDGSRWQLAEPNWSKNRQRMKDKPQDFYPYDHMRGEFSSFYDRARYLCSSLLAGAANRAIARAIDAEAAQELAMTAVALRRYPSVQSRPVHGRWSFPKRAPRVRHRLRLTVH